MKHVPALVLLVAAPAASQALDLEAELRALAAEVRSLEREAGLARADRLLREDALDDARLRADVHLARGLLLALAPAPREDGSLDPDGPRAARDDLRSVQALAGPTALRLDAIYDEGWIDLAAAEAWYARIPEVMEAAGVPPTPPPAAAPGAADDGAADAPDPLETARDRYEAARGGFVRRLRLDWRDEDTRANLEWIQRRLHELARIEEERQQQQDPEQPSEDEQPQDETEEQSDQEQQQQEGEDGSPDEAQPPEGEEGDTDEDSDPSRPDEGAEDEPRDESRPGEEPPPDAPGEPGEEEPRDGEPSETPRPPEGEPLPSEEAEGGEPTERVLTREEVLRLLDRLEQLEQEGERVRALLRQSRRVPVERDW